MNAEIRDDVGERARRRIIRRLMPFLFVLYVFNYMNRVNVGYAALQMRGDLGFSNTVFGFGAGIFFIGYFLLQIPSTLLTELWSARNFITLSVIVWGALAALCGLIDTADEFYWVRFFLGIAQAGFFPGVLVYLTHWFRYEDRAKAVAMFMMAIPTSNMAGAAIAAALMRIDWLGWNGWRWLLILEGLPTVVFGVVAFFYLTDRPSDARWLPDAERQWITGELEREKERKKAAKKLSTLEALRHPQVIILALACFCYITNSVGLSSWLPTIVRRISGLSTTQVILISGIPWLVAIPMMLITAWHSDKTRERRWHAAIPLLIVGIALSLSIAAGNHLVLAIAAFSMAAMALYSFPSPFWALPTIFLSGPAAAASIALINATGNLGGFAGPYLIGYLADRTGGYTAGLMYLVMCGLIGSALVLALRIARPAGEMPVNNQEPQPVAVTR
ncbi:MAG: MFS transporter [Acidobacteria bacterium]|nr:MAG: MFS transporter [Acidobacteriota bacterium]